MNQDGSSQQEATPAEAKVDSWEGVPPECGTPRSWTPLWFALLGFAVWVGILLVLLVIRFRTSVV